MKWEFNDGSSLSLNDLDAYFQSVEIKLFSGSDLPTMRVKCQRANNSFYDIGEEITGSFILSSGDTYDIRGYVFSMVDGAETTYDILLRPISEFNEVSSRTYDSIKDALSDFEQLDEGSLPDNTNCRVHAFNEYGVNIIDRLAPGYAKGIYGRGYNRLIFRNPEQDEVDYVLDKNNIWIEGVTKLTYNKLVDKESAVNEVNDQFDVINLSEYVSASKEYSEFYDNVLSNKKYNIASSLVTMSSKSWLPLEPCNIVDTKTFAGSYNEDLPDRMYVRDVTIKLESSGMSMNLVLAY